jgi:hypothetical protein
MTQFDADWSFAMTYDANIYRSANTVIERHGGSAPLWAFQRVNEFLANGDSDGVTLWLEILGAIQELQRPQAKEAGADDRVRVR